MTKQLARLAAISLTAATCTALTLTCATAAGAATPTPTPTGTTAAARLATIQALAKIAVSNRQTSINNTVPVVTANPVITAGDRSTLLATLGNDLSGLTALGARIATDQTAGAAEADYQTIFTGYRVYALALPQVRYAEAVDDITSTVTPRLTDAQSTLAGLLTGVDASKDTTAVQAAMTDLGKQIAAITSTTSGLSATVLAYTPAQYDANHALLSQPRATLGQARSDIRTATADIATVVKALQ